VAFHAVSDEDLLSKRVVEIAKECGCSTYSVYDEIHRRGIVKKVIRYAPPRKLLMLSDSELMDGSCKVVGLRHGVVFATVRNERMRRGLPTRYVEYRPKL
jgi:hypothetical protein